MTDSFSRNAPILIVEDEVLIRQLAVMAFEDLGFHIVEAGSAQEAIDLLEALPDICALVTDIQMPGTKDGLDLAIHVRRKFPEVAIVLTSGRPLPEDRQRPARSAYLPKPWEMERLVELVQFEMEAKHVAGCV